MSKPDTKYLDQKPSGCWRFKWAVPSDCRAAFDGMTICGTEYKGQKFITKSLGTHSLRDARLVRTQLLAECEYAVREARRQATGDSRELYRAHVRSMEQQVRREPGSLGPLYESMADVEPSTPDQEAFLEALKTVHLGHDSALVKCTLKEALENYQHDREGKVDPKTLSAASRAVTTYLEYVNKLDMPLESISRVDVKGYIRASEAKGKTISNRLTYLSSIFKAAQDYGKIGEAQRNPFEAHRVERKDSQSYQRFTGSELRAIFDATEKYREIPKDYHKYILPRLGYATGCRLEELCSLQRAQIREEGDTVFIAIAEGVDVYKGKTLNAGRRIPIHGSLAEEVIRWRDSDTHTLLFPVLESKRADGKLGDKYGKSFGRLKTELGIGGGRQKGFHSFRVHMATNLEQAGVAESRAVWILGHTRNLSLSYGLYSKGPSLEQLREDVEAAVGYGLREELGGAW